MIDSVQRTALALCMMLAVGLAACAEWGTIEDATEIYNANKGEIEETYRTLHAQRELKYVYSDLPADDLTEAFRYGEFSESAKHSYLIVSSSLKKLGIDRVVIHRSAVEDEAFEYADFIVFSRGFGGDTESISIVRTQDPNVTEPWSSCVPVDEMYWYVCHIR